MAKGGIHLRSKDLAANIEKNHQATNASRFFQLCFLGVELGTEDMQIYNAIEI